VSILKREIVTWDMRIFEKRELGWILCHEPMLCHGLEEDKKWRCSKLFLLPHSKKN